VDKKTMNILKNKLGEESYKKLIRIDDPKLHQFIAKYIELCNPDKVFLSLGSPDDIRYIRESAIKNGEESKLAIECHTVHFDNYYDQARDKEHTCILLPKGVSLNSSIRTKDRDDGLKEIHDILKDIMKGKEMYVCFFCLGPTNSKFSILCVQLTDSSYVVHNENILYEQGYEEFVRRGKSSQFFKFIHSQGELDERKTSKNLDKRRIYIDTYDDIVYSVNTQYGGNSIGLKKLAMRLGIKKGSEEGWLNEHMLLMGIHGPKNRVTYFTGAFPSLCGKTSTAVLEGETVVGDDIIFMRAINGEARAVNVERGIFGIIEGVDSKEEPLLWKELNIPNEIIFSNVLVTKDKKVHWVEKDGEVPKEGYNHSGKWFIGKKDADGKEIPCSHPNARFTFSLRILDNVDPKLEDPLGVPVSAIVFGGRDSDTWVPVEESFDWVHGVITKGASLESESTAAILGKQGVREFNPMSNIDFLSIPIGKYIQNYLNFGKKLKKPPVIFSVNYFLKNKEGKYLNEKTDKRVWYKWMELRVHGEVDAIETPTGRIPKYENLKRLFKEVLNKEYPKEDYNEQFMIKIPENLAKISRIEDIYEKQVSDTPKILFEILKKQKQRLIQTREKYRDYILPDEL
jgi:phosphoenolpyruvate carboxykinase (GTP)